MICFSIVLYDGMSGYIAFAKEKIHVLRQTFPNCIFNIIMDVKTAEDCINYFEADDIQNHVYNVKGTSKATLMLRFLPIFQVKYSEYDVVIIDVHDDIHKQIKWITTALGRLSKENKDVFCMYIHSSDEDCPYEWKLHKTCHTHRDAGFSIWKAGGEAREKITNEGLFEKFLLGLQSYYKSYSYGADEVLMDDFLSQHVKPNHQILKKNVFTSCRCSKSPLPIVGLNKSFYIDGTIHFVGLYDMYVCSRVDECDL